MQFLNTFLPSIRDWESWEDNQPTAAAPGPFIKLIRKKNPLAEGRITVGLRHGLYVLNFLY
jgi:hypothetical protein